jgi:hypothetical protein
MNDLGVEPNAQSTLMPYLRFALRAATDITVTILVPAILAGFLGKVLSGRLGSGRIVLVVCLLLAFVATAFILVKKVRTYAKEYQHLIDASVRHGSARR